MDVLFQEIGKTLGTTNLRGAFESFWAFAVVTTVHANAMPVSPTKTEEHDLWTRAAWEGR